MLKRRCVQTPDVRFAALPFVLDSLASVAEEGQIQPEFAISSYVDNLTHAVQEFGLSIWRKPHDFVLITIIGKAQILRQRLIKDS
jgi:Sec-independent protein secretion pathway component TatC